MIKAARIQQVYILKDGVMFQINSGVLKMNHFKPLSNIKNIKETKKKKLKKS